MDSTEDLKGMLEKADGDRNNISSFYKNEQDFDDSIIDTLDKLSILIVKKGREYRRNNNPFHNFERGAELSGKTREEVLQGFLLKHLISVEDMRNDSKLGIHVTEEKINEKYNDILVYFLIEKQMMLENMRKYNEQLEHATKL